MCETSVGVLELCLVACCLDEELSVFYKLFKKTNLKEKQWYIGKSSNVDFSYYEVREIVVRAKVLVGDFFCREKTEQYRATSYGSFNIPGGV